MVKSGRAGITILEVLVAMTIFSLAVIPLFTLYRGQRKQASQASFLLEAQCHLLEALARVESTMYARRFKMDEVKNKLATVEVQWGKHPQVITEELTIRRSKVTNGLWRIDCTVRWQESRGTKKIPRELSLSRLLAEPVDS